MDKQKEVLYVEVIAAPFHKQINQKWQGQEVGTVYAWVCQEVGVGELQKFRFFNSYLFNQFLRPNIFKAF